MEKSTVQIEEKAYFKYVNRGREDGYDQQDWYEAEKEVSGRSKNRSETTKKTAVKRRKK